MGDTKLWGSCLAPTLSAYRPGSAQGTTVRRCSFCPGRCPYVRAYGARPCPSHASKARCGSLRVRLLPAFGQGASPVPTIWPDWRPHPFVGVNGASPVPTDLPPFVSHSLLCLYLAVESGSASIPISHNHRWRIKREDLLWSHHACFCLNFVEQFKAAVLKIVILEHILLNPLAILLYLVILVSRVTPYTIYVNNHIYTRIREDIPFIRYLRVCSVIRVCQRIAVRSILMNDQCLAWYMILHGNACKSTNDRVQV